jgi:oxygen-dependent protoporphyrinogen oxidase
MKTAVIGAGPAGCAAAYTLGKNGHDVALFEAQDHVGGRTSQVMRDGFNLGSGALFLMGGIYPRTNAILKELGHYDDLVPWDARTSLIDSDGKRYSVDFDQVMSFLRLPMFGLHDKLRIGLGVLTQLLSPGPKTCFDGAELARYDRGENLERWSRRILGKKGTDYITVPYMGFLYAVPMTWLSTPLFQAIIRQFYKLSLSVPPRGMGQICDWLVEGTPRLTLRLSSSVESVTTRGTAYTVSSNTRTYDVDAVVVASEPGVAAGLLRDLVPTALTEKLRGCRYSEYAHAQVCYEKNPWPGSPVSIALPTNPNSTWGAAVLQSHRHPNAVPRGGEAVGVYFYTPPLARMTDEDITRAALGAVATAFGPAPEPSFVHLFHYQRGLSIAGPGHYATMNSLHAELPRGIYLAGDYFAHAGVEAAISSGELAAKRLTHALESGPGTVRSEPPSYRTEDSEFHGVIPSHS